MQRRSDRFETNGGRGAERGPRGRGLGSDWASFWSENYVVYTIGHSITGPFLVEGLFYFVGSDPIPAWSDICVCCWSMGLQRLEYEQTYCFLIQSIYNCRAKSHGPLVTWIYHSVSYGGVRCLSRQQCGSWWRRHNCPWAFAGCPVWLSHDQFRLDPYVCCAGGWNCGFILVGIKKKPKRFQGGFFAKIADPRIGGTYATLLNTVSNFGGTWPKFIVLAAVDWFTARKCRLHSRSFSLLRCWGWCWC